MKFIKHIQNYFPDCYLEGNEVILLQKIHLVEQNNLSKIVSWPPNIFLILYTLLEYTDKYRLIVSPQSHFKWDNRSLKLASDLSKEWESYISNSFSHDKNRDNINQVLRGVFSQKNLNLGVYDLLNDTEFTSLVFILVVSIDELFSNINICDDKYENLLNFYLLMKDAYFRFDEQTKDNGDEYKSICNLASNDSKYGFVTYKTSVPQTGLTINNLTQNLTFIKPSVKPRIIKNKLNNNVYDKKSYNILFLPWPLEISPDSFKPSEQKIIDVDAYFDFFDYSPTADVKLTHFYSAIISAIERVGTLDLIVLPECALNDKSFDKLKDILFEYFGEYSPALLSGVYGKDHVNNCAKNAAKLAVISDTRTFDIVEQKKHHRWFLDKSQLRTYNLAGALDPGKKWWENISIDRRNLLVVHSLNGVKLCPLICEDLARQEPVAQAVRAIGPNLVVSLLLDGPQLKGRWPGKYSAVLSDDPGASVFSVTALGMSLRSTGSGDLPSRGVALWSEPQNGAETLELKEDSIGLILELDIKNEEMWSIDGRVRTKPVLRKRFCSCIPFEYDNSMLYLKNRLDKTVQKMRLK